MKGRGRLPRLVLKYVVYLAPFLLLYQLYERVRALIVAHGTPVYYSPFIALEEKLFGRPLPLLILPYHNLVLDTIAGIVYAMHPLYFFAFALFLMVRDVRRYERLIIAFTISSAAAVAAYYMYPTEPPWMVIPGVERPPNLILKLVEVVAGAQIDPNPYAAMPSMHVCMATIFAYCAYGLARRRSVRLAALSWPILMSFATIYTVNHYLADIVAGAMLGVTSCALAGRLQPRLEKLAALLAQQRLYRPVRRG